MKIYLASDHAGFEYKEKIKKFLADLGYAVEDCGAYKLDPEDDYPDFIASAAKAVSKNPENRAIILGGSGEGEAMAANRYPGVRATVYYGGPIDIVKISREHNDANILSLGARFMRDDEALKASELWLRTPFSGEVRHQRRIDKIDA
jgi:ribose 5-phosphate isomerase B